MKLLQVSVPFFTLESLEEACKLIFKIWIFKIHKNVFAAFGYLLMEMVRRLIIQLDTPVTYRRYVTLINTNQKRYKSLKIGEISS